MSGCKSICLLKEKEFSLWDSFVDDCELGTIFNKSFWLKNIFHHRNIKFNIVAKFDRNNKIVGGFAFGYKIKFGFLKIIEPPSITPYNSFLVKDKNLKNKSKNESHYFKVIHELIQFLDKNFNYINSTLSINYKDIRPFIWSNYKESVYYTYTTPLTDINLVLENLDPDIKRRVKKAKNLQFKIIKTDDEDNINVFYELQELSFFKQNHTFKLSKDQFIDFMKVLFDKEKARIYTIYLKDTPVASCVVVFDKSKAYYWLAGSDPKHLNTGLNQLLFTEMLADLSKNSIKAFDFLGANTNTIAKYKSTYNFELTPYYSIEKVIGTIPKMLFMIKKTISW